MNILIIGGGGREHALAWKLAKSDRVRKIYVAPGNGGTASGSLIIENIDLNKTDELISFAKKNHIGLTVVGPEVPLSEGIVDDFQKNNLKIFGPSKAAAQLESSKEFAKDFMRRHNIPTASYQTFTDLNKAKEYVKKNRVSINDIDPQKIITVVRNPFDRTVSSFYFSQRHKGRQSFLVVVLAVLPMLVILVL